MFPLLRPRPQQPHQPRPVLAPGLHLPGLPQHVSQPAGLPDLPPAPAAQPDQPQPQLQPPGLSVTLLPVRNAETIQASGEIVKMIKPKSKFQSPYPTKS